MRELNSIEGIVVVTSSKWKTENSKPWVEDLSPATSDSSCDHPTYIWQTKEFQRDFIFPPFFNNQVQMRVMLWMEGTVQVSRPQYPSGERDKKMDKEERFDQGDER